MAQAKLQHLLAVLIFGLGLLSGYLVHMQFIPAMYQPFIIGVCVALIAVLTFASNNITSLFSDPLLTTIWWAHVLGFANGLLGTVNGLLPHFMSPGPDLDSVVAVLAVVMGLLSYIANMLMPAGTSATMAAMTRRTAPRG